MQPNLPPGKGNRCSQLKNLATVLPTSGEQPHSLQTCHDVANAWNCSGVMFKHDISPMINGIMTLDLIFMAYGTVITNLSKNKINLN